MSIGTVWARLRITYVMACKNWVYIACEGWQSFVPVPLGVVPGNDKVFSSYLQNTGKTTATKL